MNNRIIFKNIRLPFDAPEECALEAARKKAVQIGVKADLSMFHINKKSVDARKRKGALKPHFIYSVSVDTDIVPNEEELTKADAGLSVREELSPKFGRETLASRVLVVGFGPAGMFCAHTLAKYGYAPIVIERGSNARERHLAVESFYKTGKLEESNIQFGAGGAGTFSDGKLVTRISDPKCSYVIRMMHEFGAPDEILYLAKPHIGTDKLLGVVDKAAEEIIKLGGEIRYNTRLDDIEVKNGKIISVTLSGGEKINPSLVVLATGHSARDTYEMLFKRGINMIPKPFSVGVRIEHLQKSVDESLYGSFAGDRRLPVGEYNLSHREGEKAVYTFCMCPGGEVVAAASEEGGVVTNGMSRYKRDGRNANAALAVSVNPTDCGKSPLDGVEYQRRLERLAFEYGGGNYFAPAETVGDFIEQKKSGLKEPSSVLPTYMSGKVRITDLNEVLPKNISDMLRLGIHRFANKMRCFADKNALLTGVETRTSSPIRIVRDENHKAMLCDNLYPCGEGAGYAGGITSAAVDGINTAFAIMERYKSKNQ